MFPITLKWVDNLYDKIESACIHMDDIVSKDQESAKYVEGLKNVGNNVKQFCSTLDPLKYAEDQLTNLGATIEQLCSTVVPSSVDTMMSAVNNIFAVNEADYTACTNLELSGSVAEPVASVNMNEEVASTGKLDREDNNTIQTDQSFDDKDSSPIEKGSKTGFCSPCQIAEVELKEFIQSPKKTPLDESCIVIDKNDWFTSQFPLDPESPKIKAPSLSTSKLRSSQSHMRMRTKSKSSISTKPLIFEEPAFTQPTTSSNHDTWESEWEII